MALTDQEIRYHWRIANLEDDSWMPHIHERFARAIESAATAPLLARIAELTSAIDQEMCASHMGVFNDGDDPVTAIKKLMQWSQGVGEYFAGEKEKDRIAALTAQVEQCRKETESLIAAACTPLISKIVDMEVEQAAQPVAQEPFAWAAVPNAFAHPSMERFLDFEEPNQRVDWTIVPLYTAPPKAVPLTDEQIESAAVEHEDFGFGRIDGHGITTHGFSPEGLRAFVRAVEQANGITPATVEKG